MSEGTKKKRSYSRKPATKKEEVIDPSMLSEKDQAIAASVTINMDEETKAEWYKRRAREDAEHKASLKVVDRFYVKKGSKLVEKIRKSNGSCYTIYRGNFKKHPEILTDEVKSLLKEG